MIEYVFLVSIMAVGCIAAVGVMRQGVADVMQKSGESLGAGNIPDGPVDL
jgi:Flp pilus assembly pilin Flp